MGHWITWVLVCALICAALVPLIYALAKKKYWLLFAEGIVILCVVLCLYLFPTQFPYADPWIMGKTREQIVSVYGAPTGYDQGYMISYFLGKDRGFFGAMASGNDVHYYIYFDSDGRACRMEKGCQLGG